MRLRAATLVCALIALAAPTAAAPAANPTIAQGVSAGGVDLSGLTVLQAAQKLKADATDYAMRPMALNVAGRSFHLAMADAGMRLNATATAQAALNAPPAPADPTGGGTATPSLVNLVLTHSHAKVAAFVHDVSQKVTVQPRNATLKIGIVHMHVRRARAGHTLDEKATAQLIDTTIDDDAANRNIHVAVAPLRAGVNADDIRQQNTTIVTIDRAHFTLRLFKHLKIARRYGIAVGRAGLETPTGLYHVQDKQVNPSWHVPNASWAGSLAGQVIPPGPDDPIVARWMGLANGVGIHGTNEPWSIGSAASHGCIRMRVPDVIALFDRVPLGTPVLIH
jgi:lipoprotein-anchoring transpeptidase ErfK/SrfK